MDGKNKELELLERALERFRKITMLTVERLGLLLAPYGPDATIRIARQDKALSCRAILIVASGP